MWISCEKCITNPRVHRAQFGYSKNEPVRCKDHTEGGMVLVIDRCEIRECWGPAKYGVDGGQPVRCEEHKEENMVTYWWVRENDRLEQLRLEKLRLEEEL